MTTGPAEDGVSPATARQLQIISVAMGAGLTLMAGLVLWTYRGSGGKIPTSDEVRAVNALTTVAMVAALAATIASEVAWRALLRKFAGSPSAGAHTAFVVRLACREGAGLLGMTVAYIAALNGVLRVYPAYWVNLAPYALFLGFLAAHWPSVERLTAETREIAGRSGRQ